MRLWGEIPTDVVIMLSYIVAKRFKSSTIISSTLETPTTHNLRERKKFKSTYEPSALPGRNISHFLQRVFPLAPGRNASPSQGYPQN